MGGYFDFMSVVMFQGLLHHLFVELVKYVSSVLLVKGHNILSSLWVHIAGR